MSVLSLRNLWKKSETFQLKDISFSVYEREWLLISGPVGQGKEVLQQIILGFDTDWDGEVLLYGENIRNSPPLTERIAFIPTSIIDENKPQTVYDYLALPLRLLGLTEEIIAVEIQKVSTKYSFFNHFDKLIKDLPFREKVFVSFLRVLLKKPCLLVIEEPFYELPDSKRRQIVEVIKEFYHHWEVCPVVIFSSYINEWLPYTHRVAIIEKQKLLQIGQPNSLIKDPKSLFVARYILSENFTLLKGTLENNYFTTKGFSCSLSQDLIGAGKFYEGQDVVIGIHASSFQVHEGSGTSPDVLFKVPVHLVKEGENFDKLYSNIGIQPLVAHVKKSGKMNEGDEVKLGISFKDLYFFDGHTEKRLM